MLEVNINDKWVLNRVSSESTSFSKWLGNLMNEIERKLGEENPEALAEIKKNKDLQSIKNVDNELANAREELQKAKKQLGNLGFLGKAFSGLGEKIIDKVEHSMMGSISGIMESTVGQDIDIDLLTGKRKTLSSALYDVSKERGIESEGLLYLIKSLPDLEAFLYSTNVRKFYRDHTEHSLRVAVLGDYLLEQDFGQGKLLNIISELTELDKELLKDKIWWLAGLLHDIGYPLGKMTTAVNYSLINQLLKCYPSLDLQFKPLEIGLSWQGSQEEYLKIIEEELSKEMRIKIRKGTGYNIQNLPDYQSEVYLKNPNGHEEYNFEPKIKLDHGVISALSLLNSLGTPEEIRKKEEYKPYILVAKAMAIHNFKMKSKDSRFDNQPLAFLLMLVDELQEWGRPIPIQVRDTYFTTELKKVTLLDEILLHIDESNWFMKFKDQKAKKLMNFDFNRFSKSKQQAMHRLDHGKKYTQSNLILQDIESKKKDGKDTVVREEKISI